MGQLNRVARILLVVGGALTLASLAVNMKAGLFPLTFAMLGVAVLGGVLLIVDGALKGRRTR